MELIGFWNVENSHGLSGAPWVKLAMWFNIIKIDWTSFWPVNMLWWPGLLLSTLDLKKCFIMGRGEAQKGYSFSKDFHSQNGSLVKISCFNLNVMCLFTTKFCTYPHSSAVRTCAKFWSDMIFMVELARKYVFIKFEIFLCVWNSPLRMIDGTSILIIDGRKGWQW